MGYLQNLRIGARLAAAFLLLLSFIALLSIIGVLGSRHLGEMTRSVYQDRAVPIQQLATINDLTQRNLVLVMDMLLQPGAANVEKRSTELHQNLKSIDTLWTNFSTQPQTPQEAELIAQIQARRQSYFNEALRPANQAMQDNHYDEASDLYLNKISPEAPQLQAPMDQLMKLKIEQAAHEFNKAMHTRSTVQTVMLVGAFMAMALGVVLAWKITHSITTPIAQAVQVAHMVASGDLSQRIEAQGKDETADMLQALKTMRESLVSIVSEVRQSVQELEEGAHAIANGGSDLSERTERQAASLEETSSSMVEITQAVNHNAQTAMHATQLAQQATEAATEGGHVVGQVVATMQEISQSSRQIADITSVIDGIAFQTNILALNAAVEAARAGEQGRGFAVVAAEVRNLAQRSATAAREIKTLIQESVNRVEQGATLVEQAGASVGRIVIQVRGVSTLIDEISMASREQSNSVTQVNQAISGLDNMTQNNAALVEESAAASESLTRQATALAHAVSVFRI